MAPHSPTLLTGKQGGGEGEGEGGGEGDGGGGEGEGGGGEGEGGGGEGGGGDGGGETTQVSQAEPPTPSELPTTQLCPAVHSFWLELHVQIL